MAPPSAPVSTPSVSPNPAPRPRTRYHRAPRLALTSTPQTSPASVLPTPAPMPPPSAPRNESSPACSNIHVKPEYPTNESSPGTVRSSTWATSTTPSGARTAPLTLASTKPGLSGHRDGVWPPANNVDASRPPAPPSATPMSATPRACRRGIPLGFDVSRAMKRGPVCLRFGAFDATVTRAHQDQDHDSDREEIAVSRCSKHRAGMVAHRTRPVHGCAGCLSHPSYAQHAADELHSQHSNWSAYCWPNFRHHCRMVSKGTTIRRLARNSSSSRKLRLKRKESQSACAMISCGKRKPL